MDGHRAYQVWVFCLVALLTCRSAPPSVAPAMATLSTPGEARGHPSGAPFLDALARDTWTYLQSPQTTAHHLPYSWWSPTLSGDDYANPAEIGLYTLAFVGKCGRAMLAMKSPSRARPERQDTHSVEKRRL